MTILNNQDNSIRWQAYQVEPTSTALLPWKDVKLLLLSQFFPISCQDTTKNFSIARPTILQYLLVLRQQPFKESQQMGFHIWKAPTGGWYCGCHPLKTSIGEDRFLTYLQLLRLNVKIPPRLPQGPLTSRNCAFDHDLHVHMTAWREKPIEYRSCWRIISSKLSRFEGKRPKYSNVFKESSQKHMILSRQLLRKTAWSP